MEVCIVALLPTRHNTKALIRCGRTNPDMRYSPSLIITGRNISESAGQLMVNYKTYLPMEGLRFNQRKLFRYQVETVAELEKAAQIKGCGYPAKLRSSNRTYVGSSPIRLNTFLQPPLAIGGGNMLPQACSSTK